MAEPLGVAFIEIEPIAAGFRAKTEAQVRSQLAGASAGIPPSPATAAATRQVQAHAAAASEATVALSRETAALEQKAVAAGAAATAEGRAAAATQAHAAAASKATGAIAGQSALLGGATRAATGLNAPLAAAAVSAFVLFQSAQEADAFQAELRGIEVATGAAADELDRAADRAIALGRDLNVPLTSATDAARAINLLTRSGLNLDESLDAARGTLLLTAASGEELRTSVQLTDTVLDAFNLRADESVRVADALAVGLRFTQGSASEAGRALVALAPAAQSAGLELEDVNTLVLQLAESGIETTRAAGLLRQSLLRINTETFQKNLSEAGISMDVLLDAQGRLRPDAFARLAEELENVDEARRRQILTEAFGARGALAVIRLVEQQRAGFQRMAATARETGAAQAEAEAKTRTLGGALTDTRKDVADFGREVGGVVDGPLVEFVDNLGLLFRAGTDTVSILGDLAGGVRDLGNRLDEVTRTEGVTSFFGDLAGISGAEILSSTVGRISDVFSDEKDETGRVLVQFNTNVQDHLDRMASIVDAGASKVGAAAGGISENLTTQLAVAEATGGEGDQLRILRQQRENARIRLERNRRRLRTDDVGQQAVQDAAADLAAADAAIQAILDGQRARAEQAAADAERKAGEIARAADRRDEAFVDAIEAGFGRRQDAVSAASRTDTLTDDITANVKLRNFLARMIAATQERIQDVRAAGRSAEVLVTELRALRRSRDDVRREIAQLQAEQRRQATETLVEQTQLDLQILEARVGDDPSRTQTDRLVAAHNRVIQALRRAQRLTKARSVEWKRLQLQIEQEKAAIRALREAQQPDDERQQDSRTFSQQAFEFLQTQQGFASNLLGNLIPTTATSGLVAGGTAGGALQVPSPFSRSTATEASRVRGVTAGQGDATLMLLREILSELRRGNRSTEHPEARAQRRVGAAAGDYTGGGGAVGM